MKVLTEEELIKLTNGMTAISLGWGVQSWAMVTMVCLGDLPMPDLAIHSDTTWERETTYRFSEFWGQYIKDCGIDYRIACDPNYASRVNQPDKGLYIPAYTLSEARESQVVVLPDGEEIDFSLLDDEYYYGESELPEGWRVENRKKGKVSKGQLMRSCTDKWKIAPLRRLIAQELQVRGKKKTPGAVTVWLGISLDEFMRAKHSPVKYIVHQYPLLDLNVTRQDCEKYLRTDFLKRGYGFSYALDELPARAGVNSDAVEAYLSHLRDGKIQSDYLNVVVPGKSSCTFCPYHSLAVWKDMQRSCTRNLLLDRVRAVTAQVPELKTHESDLMTLVEYTVGDLEKDWQEAVAVDEAIRHKRPGYESFVSDQRIPLTEIARASDNQYNPEDDATCDSGYCFM